MKLTKSFFIPLGVGTGTLAVGAGTAVGVILPKALKAKKGLQAFVADGGSYNSLASKEKVNIVALGDSETAGYNGYMGADHSSYSDFLAASFQNANKLGTYNQFGISGGRLTDIKRQIFENADLMRKIAGQKDENGKVIKGTQADMITITIGANDILSYLKILHIPFGQGLSFLKDGLSAKQALSTKDFDPTKKLLGIFKNIDNSKLDQKQFSIKLKLSENLVKNKLNIENFDANLLNDFINNPNDFAKLNKEQDLVKESTSLKNFIIKANISPKIIKDKIHFTDKYNQNNIYRKYWSEELNKLAEGKNDLTTNADFERNIKFKNNFGLPISKADSYNRFHNTVNDIKSLLNGNNNDLLHLDKSWYPKIFDLIKREMAVLVRDLHEANPNAQIVVLGHAFPFRQFDESSFTLKHPELGNQSLKQLFERLLSSINEGANKNLSSDKNKFVSFYNVDELQVNKDQKFKDFVKPLNLKDVTSFENSVKNNAMPNINDIHPSTFGHEKIGEALFRIYGKENDLTNEEISKNIQRSFSVSNNLNPDQNLFVRKDEEEHANVSNPNEDTWQSRFESAKKFKQMTNLSKNIPDNMKPLLEKMVNNFLFSENTKNVTIKDLLKILLKDNLSLKLIKDNLASLDNINLSDAINGFVNPIKSSIRNYLNNENEKNINILIDSLFPIFGLVPAMAKSLPEGSESLLSIVNMFNEFVSLANDIKLIDKNLLDGKNNESASEMYEFKISDWGLKHVLSKFGSILTGIQSLMSMMSTTTEQGTTD